MDVNKNIINSDKTIKGKVSVNNEEKERYNVKFNDLFLTRTSETSDEIGLTSAFIGKDENTVFSGFILRARPKKDNINSMFYAYYMRSNKMRNNIIKYSSITTRALINSQNLSKLKIAVPSIKEQDKIFHMLWNFDKKIEFLNNKLKIVIIFKKYLLQNLFPKSGELAPKLRFKQENGENYLEWKDRKLNEILVEHKEKSTGNEDVYSVSVYKGLVNQVEHLGRRFATKDTSKYNLVKPGDIVYTKSPTGDFPLGIIKQSRVSKNVIVSPLYGVFTPETKYLGYILNDYFESSVNTYNYLHPIVQKGAKNTMNISNKTFLSRSLMLPIDFEEQKFIANFLFNIDKKINLIKNQIDKMDEYKKGLLQQMFVEMPFIHILILISYKNCYR